VNRPYILIEDVEDPRIAAYRDIRERDLVGRQGKFVAEGKTVLNVLFSNARLEAESVFMRENRVAGAADLLARVPDPVPIYVAPGSVMDQIAGFHMHRGVLAIGRRTEEPTIGALLDQVPEEALVVALAGIANHDNMGSIFRNAAAFGVDAIVMDEGSCDPLYRKAIRVSVGAALKVSFAREGSTEAMVDALVSRGFEVLALSPSGEIDIAAIVPGKRMALLLGAEGPGLPGELLQRLTSVRIAMRVDFDSLNVAAASAIALHRLWRT
jgi:tRNA G18 (ribose-2'-O)-methylase SpoU